VRDIEQSATVAEAIRQKLSAAATKETLDEAGELLGRGDHAGAAALLEDFINRGGRGLSATRRRELERAKRILQRRRTSGRKTAKRRAGARKSTVRQAKRRTTAARR